MRTKVFHIITHFDLGGAEKVAVNIASSKNKEFEEHLVEVVSGGGEYSEKFVQNLKKKGIVYHRSRIKNNKLGIVLFPFWFLLLFLKHRPDIIHTHTEVPDLSIYLFYRLFGWMTEKRCRYIRTIHNTVLWSQWGRIGKVVEGFFIKHGSNIAISLSVQKAYYQAYSEMPPIIYNGVEKVEQKPFAGINHQKTNILFAGRLEEQKGVNELLKVVDVFKNDNNLEFWLVGNGSLYGSVIERIKGSTNVHIQEKVFGLSAYLSSFDYLFMPSHFEGLALMSIEASFAKVPTIINSCLGLEDTLPEDWPLKVKDNNVNEYVKIFKSIVLYDNEILGQQAYDFVNSRFSIEEMQQKYEYWYFMKKLK